VGGGSGLAGETDLLAPPPLATGLCWRHSSKPLYQLIL